jgi:hypothetical protein
MQPDRWFGAGSAEGADAGARAAAGARAWIMEGVRGFHNQTLVILSIA